MQLAPGQNAPVSGTAVAVTATGPVDLTALVLSADGKVSGDDDMVFYNQRTAPGASLSGSTLQLSLESLRLGAERVALVATPASEDVRFGQLTGLGLRISAGGHEYSFTPEPHGSETALVLCELYLRNGQWKVRALGQGYDSGLAGVATEYGIDVDEHPAPAAAAPAPSPTAAVEPAPAAQRPRPRPAAAPAVDMTKTPTGAISLTKSSSATIPLTKADKGTLRLTCSLRWDGRTHGGASDLDLYALFIDDDEVEKAVYYKDRGSLTDPPYMQLSGDSLAAGEETITVVAGRHRYVLFCAYSALGNGAGSFHSYRAHVVVDDGQGSVITVPLFSKKTFSYWVAIALLDFTDPTGVSVRQVEQYGKNFSEKRPLLTADGSFRMSAGKIEFKRKKDRT